ncbi:MAG: DUF4910 domain-containing protein [Bacteroidia bacterium]|nr:DUF4910 domain-containing protein [Bacteroidia bacterium]
MSVSLNNKILNPGIDFLVAPSSCSANGTYKLQSFNKNIIENTQKYKSFINQDLSNTFIIIDTTAIEQNNSIKREIEAIKNYNLFKAKGIVKATGGKLSYSLSDEVNNFPLLYIRKELLSDTIQKIGLNIKNKYYEKYKTQNVAGYIPGQVDSFIVFTAHYDHLGMMGGDCYFPGANDNASGVSMVLNLAKYYAENKEKSKYSTVFIFFSAEDAGLLGSLFFVERPLIPLSKIKFLINLDLVGTGDEGIQVVNSTVFKREFEILAGINEEKKYVKTIKQRGEAANSDHYPFYAKGVKCFFIYTLGGISEYHNVSDRAETLPLTEYEDLFRLIVGFVEKL